MCCYKFNLILTPCCKLSVERSMSYYEFHETSCSCALVETHPHCHCGRIIMKNHRTLSRDIKALITVGSVAVMLV